MKIIIQSLDFVVGEKLRYFLEEHIKTLPSVTGLNISRAEIILGEESADVNDQKFCAIRLVLGEKVFLVTRHASHYEKAFIIALEELKVKVGDNPLTLSEP
jgi:hypothetical protein